MTLATEALQAVNGDLHLSAPKGETGIRPAGVQRQRAALAALCRRTTAACDPGVTLENGAALIAEFLNVEFYGVAERTDDGKVLLRVWPTVPDATTAGVKAAVEFRTEPEQTRSLTAYALAANQPIVVADLGRERRFKDEFLRTQGIHSALLVPAPTADAATALAGFSRKPRRFSADEALFAETIGHLVSTSIHRNQALKILAEERQFAQKVLETLDSIVLVMSPTGRIILVNRAFELITGFTVAEVQDRPIWNFLLAPDEVPLVQNALHSVATAAKSAEHESFIVTKRGERRRVRWSYAVLSSSSTGVNTLIATGSDITAQREAEARAQTAEVARQKAQTQLRGILSIVGGEDSAASLDESPAAAMTPTPAAPVSFPATAEPAAGASPFQPLPAEGMADRRRRPRRSFSYCQRIAPMEGDTLPPSSMFRVVQCHDISAGGFAFVSHTQPAHDSYVVVLGSAPVLIYVKVSVAHITPTKLDGHDAYLVGCKYTGRVDY